VFTIQYPTRLHTFAYIPPRCTGALSTPVPVPEYILYRITATHHSPTCLPAAADPQAQTNYPLMDENSSIMYSLRT